MHEHIGQWGMTNDCAQSRYEGDGKVTEIERHNQYAEECRRLASKMRYPEDKKRLEELAEAWTAVAKERAKNKKAIRLAYL